MEEKVYLNGMFIKEKVFDDGGSILNVSVKVEDFKAELDAHKNDRGYVNLKIKKRREPSETGITHYCEKDNYQPKANTDDLPF